ncbi:hypothetical protein BZZ01_09735 [Nostocales cyanobacterium HT-58-2]|nr:hypothetical protein BZZ01_09735 [Nostocales cyanobacterium HT-58-2]
MILAKFLESLFQKGVELWSSDHRLHYRAPKGIMTPELRAELVKNKAEILAFLHQFNTNVSSTSESLMLTSKDRDLPLSFVQEEFWLVEQITPGESAFRVNIAIHLKGKLKVALLKHSLNQVVQRHEALRTTFTNVNGQLVQVIRFKLLLPLPVVDLCELPQTEREPKALYLASNEVNHPFDLAQGPLIQTTLLKLAETEHILYLSVHHIVFDIASAKILLQELATIYEAFWSGKVAPLSELPVQYADFAIWQREQSHKEALNIQLDYWKKQLANAPAMLALPTDYPRPLTQSFQVAHQPFQLSPNLYEALQQLSRNEGVTLFMMLLAGFKTLLHRYSGHEDILVGSPTLGRVHRNVNNLIGAFAYPLLLRTDLSGDPTFRELLTRIRKVTWGAYTNQEVPFIKVAEVIQRNQPTRHTQLFQVMFTYPPQIEAIELPELVLSPVQNFAEATSHYDLILSMMESSGGLSGVLMYNPSLFNDSTITSMVENFQTLLKGIAAEPEQCLSRLPLLSEATQRQLLLEYSKTQTDSAQVACIHQLFETQVQQMPDTVAVVSENEQLTYLELDTRAKQLAHHLKKLGVGSEVCVGVCMERSLEMVIGLLSILKAGGAYVPLNLADSRERLDLILKETQVSVVLTQKHLQVKLPAHGIYIICLESNWDIAWQNQESLVSTTTAENLACILYSSLKATSVEHRGIYQRLQWLQNEFNLSTSDVVVHKTSLALDFSIYEIFWPLAYGGRLVITAGDQNNLAHLQNVIAEQRVNYIHLTPEALSSWITICQDSAAELSSLHCVLCTGGFLKSQVVNQLSQSATYKLYYLYSLPEAGIVAYSQVQVTKDKRDFLSEGYSTCASICILDKCLQPVPKGVIGEIYIAEEGLSRGYLNHPEATTYHFIKNPFPELPSKRLFKTGDKGRLLSNGTLELLDTGNRYTWVDSFRIYLDEVETALLHDLLIDNCVVLVRETEVFTKELVAYVVLSRPFSLEQLADRLQTVLPNVMLPSAYVPVLTLPLTATGQVDEQALTNLEVIDIELIHRWEERIRSVPEIEQVAVVVQEESNQLPPLHLSDLLPGWKANPISVVESLVASSAHLTAASEDFVSKAIAFSNGGALTLEQDAPTILTDALKRAVQQGLGKGIVYIQSDGSEIFQSYSDLLHEAEQVLTGLRELGLQPQDKVIFQLERNQDFIVAFWGCMLGGFIPVPISIAPNYRQLNSTVNKLHHAWQMLGQPIILTSQTLVQAVNLLSALYGLENFQVKTIDELRVCDPDQNWYVSQPDDLALLLLTSGSTGMPKGVMQSHRSLLNRSASTVQVNKFSSDDVSLNWFPLDHVGSIVMFHIRDVYLSCQQIHAPTETVLQDPLKWLDWINRFRATNTWAPNFAYGLVNDCAEEITRRHWDLSSMQFILNAGEAIVAKTARRFLELLAPHGLRSSAMYPAWGMSETSSAVTFSNSFSLDSSTDEDSFVEVGSPILGVCLRIVDAQNQLLEEEKIGRLQVKGSTVTSGYYNNPELNQNVFTDDGWFDTGDTGFLRKGCLTVTGRQKDIIIINGINYYSHEIEAVVEEVEGVEVSYTCACAIRTTDSNTDNLVIFFNTSISNENLLKLLKEIRREVVRKVGVNPAYLIPVEKNAIPKTSIGKIQRSQLKQCFEIGEFDPILKRIDILSGNDNTLPNWFYRKIWRRKEAKVLTYRSQKGKFLVFLDGLGLGQFLCAELERQNQTCVRVEAGSDFAQIGPNHYRIAPNSFNDYQRLLESVTADPVALTQILHLWTYNEYASEVPSLEALEEAQNQGVYSLLLLTQVLSQINRDQYLLQLWVISSYAQAILPTDEIAYEKTPMLGLIKTIPQEIPWLDCRHIDLSVSLLEESAAYILQEIQERQGDQEVAYRNKQRWIPRLETVDLSQEQNQPLPFKQGGMYLISGGLGGIAVKIAEYLLKHYQARLLLVGRTPLPITSTLQFPLEQTDMTLERIKAYRSLEKFEGEIIYQATDICDFEQLKQVVKQAKSHWQCDLSGIIHLAGLYQEQLLTELTQEDLAAIMHPKVSGTWLLHQLLKNEPQGLFISFSSVNGFFGGTGAGAYSAANHFLDSFTYYQRHKCGLQSYCLSWSLWNELGMSRGNLIKELAYARGYHAITAQQGLNSFLASLHSDQAQLLIGLDSSNRYIRRYMETDSCCLQKLCAYFTMKTDKAPVNQLHGWTLQDRFQQHSRCNFYQLQEMPLTDKGNIDKQKLIAASYGVSPTSTVQIAPRTELEHQIARIWQELFNLPQVGIHDNFFELGGHSLIATQAVSRLRDTFEVKLTLRALFELPTIADLAKHIEISCCQEQQQTSPIQRISRDKELPLSFAQQRLWFIAQLDPETSLYNVPAAIHIDGNLNITALQESVNEVIKRHEVLRTTFPMIEGRPVQVIAPTLTLTLPIVDLQELGKSQQEAEVKRLATKEAQLPFDLTRPLLRITLLQLGEKEYVWLLTMHHIVCDGWSIGILIRELAAFYKALLTTQPLFLPDMSIQYADFAVWQRQWLQGDVLKTHLAYWKQQLGNDVPVLKMPTDRVRPSIQAFRGAKQSLALSKALSDDLKQLSCREEVTIFMTLLAAFQVLLHWYTSQDDIIIGTDVANRNRPEVEGLIGFFVNQLVLRTDLSGNPTFQALLRRVREVTLRAYEHQDFPFDRLVEALKPERSLNRTPLFQVKFILQSTPVSILGFPNLNMRLLEIDIGDAKLDLLLSMEDTKQGLIGVMTYDLDLFEHGTITQFLKSFEVILHTVANHPEVRLSELSNSLTKADQEQRTLQRRKQKEVNHNRLKNIKRRAIST